MLVGSVQTPSISSGAAPREVEVSRDATSFQAMLAATEAEASPEAKTVPATRTKLTPEEARAALVSAWTERFGEAPSEETSAILTAQWAHETGSGQSMWNFNFAGLKGKGPSGLSVSQRTKEGHGASERVIVDQFRAYQTKEEGASDYLSLLVRRYSGAVQAAAEGDPGKFVSELKKGGYFTGSEAAYTHSVTSLTKSYLGRAPETDLTSGRVIGERIAELADRPPEAKSVANHSPPMAGPAPIAAHREDAAQHLTSLNPLGLGSRGTSAVPRSAPTEALPDPALFHDAITRAALRIALESDPSASNSRPEERFL